MDNTIAGGQALELQILSKMARITSNPQVAGKIFQQCMDDAGLNSINNSQDMMRFTQALSKHGEAFYSLSSSLMSEIMQARVKQANHKLTKALGKEKAESTIAECLTEIRLSTITSSQEMYKFALALIKRGGTIGVIGHSLKIQAILDGAEQD
jgi:hypothetical protein